MKFTDTHWMAHSYLGTEHGVSFLLNLAPTKNGKLNSAALKYLTLVPGAWQAKNKFVYFETNPDWTAKLKVYLVTGQFALRIAKVEIGLDIC